MWKGDAKVRGKSWVRDGDIEKMLHRRSLDEVEEYPVDGEVAGERERN